MVVSKCSRSLLDSFYEYSHFMIKLRFLKTFCDNNIIIQQEAYNGRNHTVMLWLLLNIEVNISALVETNKKQTWLNTWQFPWRFNWIQRKLELLALIIFCLICLISKYVNIYQFYFNIFIFPWTCSICAIVNLHFLCSLNHLSSEATLILLMSVCQVCSVGLSSRLPMA